MDAEQTGEPALELMPLNQMAARLGVPSKWLKERAEAGQVPGLRAGNRWLFRHDVVLPIVAAMAAPTDADGMKRGEA